MDRSTDGTEKLSFWQIIFLQSKVNGGPYYGAMLPQNHWDWPQETYLKRQRRTLKAVPVCSRSENEQNLLGG
jgi:hypothetical protein